MRASKEAARAGLQAVLDRETDGVRLEGVVAWDTFRIWCRPMILGQQPIACEGAFLDDRSVRLRFMIGIFPISALWTTAALLLSACVVGVASRPDWVGLASCLVAGAVTVGAIYQATRQRRLLEREIRCALATIDCNE